MIRVSGLRTGFRNFTENSDEKKGDLLQVALYDGGEEVCPVNHLQNRRFYLQIVSFKSNAAKPATVLAKSSSQVVSRRSASCFFTSGRRTGIRFYCRSGVPGSSRFRLRPRRRRADAALLFRARPL